MTTGSSDIARLVRGIDVLDDLEEAHRDDALDWLGTTDDIFRRAAPATPRKHLVAYFLLRDAAAKAVFLVHHRKAGLWLPTGGHVEVGEDPADTVRREAAEELGIEAVFADGDPHPRFLTVTETVGAAEARHIDVSLWYLLAASRVDRLAPDPREFADARWWTREEVAGADSSLLEPHLPRFLAKLDAPPRLPSPDGQPGSEAGGGPASAVT